MAALGQNRLAMGAAAALGLLALAAGCAPAAGPAGARRDMPASPSAEGLPAPGPAGDQVAAATQSTDAAAPVQEYAPGVPARPGAPPMGRVELRKLLQLPPGTVLYRGPGEWYGEWGTAPVQPLPYGVLWNGWLGLRLDRGLGWLPSVVKLEMTDQDGDGARYTVEPGRRWTLAAADSLRVDLRRPAPGVLVLEITGAPEPVSLAVYPGAGALHLAFPAYQPGRARLDVGEDGLRSLSAATGGLLLEFDRLPGLAVLANTPGIFQLELRPLIQGFRLARAGDDLVLRVTGQGYLPPAVTRDGPVLSLGLQGAGWGPGAGPGSLPVPAGWAELLPVAPVVSTVPAGVAVAVQTPRPHRVRLGSDGLDLVLHQPGLAGKRIVVDPGHGGAETGTATPWGLPEKDVNLAVSLALARKLEAAGARVLLLRTGDTTARVPPDMREAGGLAPGPQRELSIRAAIANWWDADALLSIHHNGGEAGAAGTEVYWYTNLNGDRSEELARLAQAALLRELGTLDRGVIRRPFGMVRLPHAPSVLVEIGFLTNPAEARFLTTPAVQERVAAALAGALEAFFRPRKP